MVDSPASEDAGEEHREPLLLARRMGVPQLDGDLGEAVPGRAARGLLGGGGGSSAAADVEGALRRGGTPPGHQVGIELLDEGYAT